MVQLGTIVKVTDKTGVVLAQCIKVLGPTGKRIAYLGDLVIVSVRWINPRKFHNVKERKKKMFAKGTLHRALVVRSKTNYSRIPGVFIRFNENAVVLVNRLVVPVSNRVYGPILREFAMRWPSLGCVTRCFI